MKVIIAAAVAAMALSATGAAARQARLSGPDLADMQCMALTAFVASQSKTRIPSSWQAWWAA